VKTSIGVNQPKRCLKWGDQSGKRISRVMIMNNVYDVKKKKKKKKDENKCMHT